MISAHLRESRLCAPPYVERSPPSTFSFFKSNFASEPRQTGPRPDRVGNIIYLFIVACTPFILRLWACLLCHATTQPHHPPVYALPYDRAPAPRTRHVYRTTAPPHPDTRPVYPHHVPAALCRHPYRLTPPPWHGRTHSRVCCHGYGIPGERVSSGSGLSGLASSWRAGPGSGRVCGASGSGLSQRAWYGVGPWRICQAGACMGLSVWGRDIRRALAGGGAGAVRRWSWGRGSARSVGVAVQTF